MARHNMRPNHLHMMIEAPGYQKLTTALYPEGDLWLASDAVFGVKKSLVVVRDHRASKEGSGGADLSTLEPQGGQGRCV